tara:strand:+ start:1342 stop:1458 length:117 start_codon:yes stop_codon:yes gene_type:complete
LVILQKKKGIDYIFREIVGMMVLVIIMEVGRLLTMELG